MGKQAKKENMCRQANVLFKQGKRERLSCKVLAGVANIVTLLGNTNWGNKEIVLTSKKKMYRTKKDREVIMQSASRCWKHCHSAKGGGSRQRVRAGMRERTGQ